MSELKATPGPWEAVVVIGDPLKFMFDKWKSIHSTCQNFYQQTGLDPDTNIKKWFQINIEGTEIIIADTGCGEHSKDNARLISAAPDMFEALEAIEAAKNLWLPTQASAEHAEEAKALHKLRDKYLAALTKALGKDYE